MKTIAIALLLGIGLSTSTVASAVGCQPQVKSTTYKTVNRYVYINHIISPIDKSASKVPTTVAEQLAKQP